MNWKNKIGSSHRKLGMWSNWSKILKLEKVGLLLDLLFRNNRFKFRLNKFWNKLEILFRREIKFKYKGKVY